MNVYFDIMSDFYLDVAIIGISWGLLRKACKTIITAVTTGKIEF